MVKNIIIAIDGVSGSGKGALAERLAKHYNCEFLPTGNIYRIVAKEALYSGIDYENDNESLASIASDISDKDMYSEDLKDSKISHVASVIAKSHELREVLNSFQRAWILKRSFSVVEGRDIGTTICPDADVKLFLTASLDVRSERRYEELKKVDAFIDKDRVYNDLNRRDSRDADRKHSPLKQAEDSCLIDTTNLTVDEMVSEAVNIIEKKLTMH